eukprot:CAMPEP_0204349570 /NCGR_PEP_ID=MMETSP0469-20131031/29633_1 /ASSEMBLY_ACC=CAM_ASM_000384 /TAXON_ID=2969 /ORGANISM="Oxyrrhis marina" /LENGTH=63 /DNA_ID=CAMNT_0051335783 /DNA_START=92 /DNA_END=281 /DNA_ORIENTATION=-
MARSTLKESWNESRVSRALMASGVMSQGGKSKVFMEQHPATAKTLEIARRGAHVGSAQAAARR